MSLVSLFSDKHGFLVTDQLVYSAAELTELSNASELAATLSAAIAAQKGAGEQAKQSGYAAGYAAGLDQAKAEQSALWQKKLLTLHATRTCELAEQRDACASLAVDIVRKIALKVAPDDWLYAQACTAAAELLDQGTLVLRVHNSQYSAMQESLSADTVFERVVADENLEPSACFIDTHYGSVEVDLETQMQHVLHLLSDDVVNVGESSND